MPSALRPALADATSRLAAAGVDSPEHDARALADEVADLSERLAARIAVDRAKPVLMERLGVTEPEAFRWIQKASMDRRLSMRQVAQIVVADGAEPDVKAPEAPEA